MANRYISKLACSASSSDIETNLSSNSETESENSQDIDTSFYFCANYSSSPGYASAESTSSVTSVTARGKKATRNPKQRTPRTVSRMMEMHRQNERNRHHLINTRMSTVCSIVPGSLSLEKETKVEMMQRIISYVAFLENTIRSVSEMLSMTPDPSLFLLLPALYQFAHAGEKSSRGKYRRKGKSRRRRMRASLSVSSSSTDADAPLAELQTELESLSTQDSGSINASDSPHPLSLLPEGHIPSWFFEDSYSPEELTLDLLDGSDVDSDVFSMTSIDTLASPDKFFSSSRLEPLALDEDISQPFTPNTQERMEKLASFLEEEELDSKDDSGLKTDSSDMADMPLAYWTPEDLEPSLPAWKSEPADCSVLQPVERDPSPPHSPVPHYKSSSSARKPAGKKAKQKKYTSVRAPLQNLTNKESGKDNIPAEVSTPSDSYRKLRSTVSQKEDSAFVHDMPLQSAQTHMALVRRQKVLTARENESEPEPETQVEKVKETKPRRVDQRRASWMNGFMMFSRLNRRFFIESNPGIHTSHISKMMGHHWRSMSKGEQLPFNLKAKAFALQMQKTLTATLDSEQEGELSDEGEEHSKLSKEQQNSSTSDMLSSFREASPANAPSPVAGSCPIPSPDRADSCSPLSSVKAE